MRPYFWSTLSRCESLDAGQPDALAIRQYGLHMTQPSKHGGKGRSMQRSSSKRATRRLLNKGARRLGRAECDARDE
jgi:hypothetical protein